MTPSPALGKLVFAPLWTGGMGELGQEPALSYAVVWILKSTGECQQLEEGRTSL